MKKLLAVSLALLLCGCWPSDMQKKATLILPAKIARGQVIGAQPLFAQINWDEDEPVAVDVVWLPTASTARESLAFVGSWKLFDVNEQEVAPDSVAVFDADSPRGKILIKKGSGIRLVLDPHIGSECPYSNLKSGRYYIIASFSGSLRHREVKFTTEKQWFEVTDGP